MHRRVVTLLAAVTLAAGCTSPVEEPPPLPRIPSASASPTEGPNAAPAAVPSAAQAETPQGAAAFARFFYAEVERAFALRDPEVIRRLSATDCEACEQFVASLTSLRDQDEHASALDFQIVSAEAPNVAGDTARVDVVYNSPLAQRFDSAGEVIYEEPAAQGVELQLRLVRGPQGWLVAEVESV